MENIVRIFNPEDTNLPECDTCCMWTATHQVQVGSETYNVCDKARCQDNVDQVKDKCVVCKQQKYGYIVLTKKDIEQYKTFSEILEEDSICISCYENLKKK